MPGSIIDFGSASGLSDILPGVLSASSVIFFTISAVIARFSSLFPSDARNSCHWALL